jgi:hypothetical protein
MISDDRFRRLCYQVVLTERLFKGGEEEEQGLEFRC